MNYMLLVYAAGNEGTRAGETQPEGCEGLAERLMEREVYVAGGILRSTETATSVRVRDGKRIVTDGPFAETYEQLAGYLLVDAKDLDEAISIAAEHPVAKFGTIEVRPEAYHPNPPPSVALSPMLCCRTPLEAIEFYGKAFGAEMTSLERIPNGRVLHAGMTIGSAAFHVTEEWLEYGADSPQSLGGSPVTIHLQVLDCDASFNRAVEAGCSVGMPPQDMFWGDRWSLVIDPFGHRWSIGAKVRAVSAEEMREALAGMAGTAV